MADTPESTNTGVTAHGLPDSPLNTPATESAAPVTPAAQAAAATIANPNATPAQKQAAVKKLNSLRIKVDGQEYQENLPFDIDPSNKEAIDYMTRQLQMSKVAQKRMGEKAHLEGEVKQFLDQLKANPKELLSNPMFGVDLKKLAAQMIQEEIDNAAKSPEQLAREKLENELRKEREERKKEQEDSQKREFERIQEVEYERYDNLMTSALEGSDLPKSPYVVKKMADYLMLGLQAGLDVEPSDVLPLVREEILGDIQQMAQSMPLETIEKLFGGDILTKIRKNNVAKAKTKQGTGAKLPDVGATKASEKKPSTEKKVTFKTFFGV